MQDKLSMKVQMNPDIVLRMGTIGERIKWLREKAGLTQEEFAKALSTAEGKKVSRGAVGNWEYGESEPKASNLRLIAEKFGTTVDWIMTGEGEVPQNVREVVSETRLTTGGEMAHNVNASQGHNARVGEQIRGFAKIPLKGVAAGGNEGYLILGDQYLGDVLAPPSLADVPEAYAVYVIGDSMLERYRHGEIVFVHPYTPVRRDDDCVIQISQGENEPPHGYVKRFISMDGMHLKVRQLNPPKILTFRTELVIAVHRIIMGGPA